MTALAATARQNGPAGLRTHADPESMCFLAPASIRLKGSLHLRYLSPKNTIASTKRCAFFSVTAKLDILQCQPSSVNGAAFPKKRERLDFFLFDNPSLC
jgi:hypothetical protein